MRKKFIDKTCRGVLYLENWFKLHFSEDLKSLFDDAENA